MAAPCRWLDRSRPSPFSVDSITNTSGWPKWSMEYWGSPVRGLAEKVAALQVDDWTRSA